MTLTIPDIVELPDIDMAIGCEGNVLAGEGGSWQEFSCPSRAEIARIKTCGCVVLQCMPCRNMIKKRIEAAIAASARGRKNFFCTLCKTRRREVTSYWELVAREVPL